MRVDNRALNFWQRSEREGVLAERDLRVAAWRHHTDRVCEVTLAGTVAGAFAGALAGPPGIVIGGIIGALTGALAGGAMDAQSLRERIRDAELDATIGVTSGDLGAASPSQPPSRRSFVSMASAGVSGSGGGGAADGPIGRSAE